MVFSSIAFLYAFLPVTLALYYIVPRRLKNVVLLFCSLLFYFYGEPQYTVLLLISSLSDYLHSLYIGPRRGTGKARAALVSSIVVNLLLLGVFKYADFLVETVNALFGAQIPLPRLSLPIGISFFTFQTMSYTIDVYRGRVQVQRNLLNLLTYVSLFPQLIAGPIVRYADVENELTARTHTWEQFAYGVRRFVLGMAKKVLLANAFGKLSTTLLGGQASSVIGLWVGIFAFMLQVYFDFSGYSDMAIGLGKFFGFQFPENFDYPFISKSISEFWRRWHMTLGGWFRDYVYFPLGGNRVKPLRWAFNLLVVWGLTGLWHGAAWNFVLWGLYFAVTLGLEKELLGKRLEKCPVILRHLYTLFFVTVSFAIFNADASMGYLHVVAGMFGGLNLPALTAETAYHIRSYAVLLILGVAGATPLIKQVFQKLQQKVPKLVDALEPVAYAALLLVVTAFLVDGSFNPFLYFRF